MLFLYFFVLFLYFFVLFCTFVFLFVLVRIFLYFLYFFFVISLNFLHFILYPQPSVTIYKLSKSSRETKFLGTNESRVLKQAV